MRPKVLVPLNNDSAEYKGLLSTVLSSKGDIAPEPVRRWLQAQGVSGVEVAGPQELGKPLSIQV
jgi:hypothetical protein